MSLTYEDTEAEHIFLYNKLRFTDFKTAINLATNLAKRDRTAAGY